MARDVENLGLIDIHVELECGGNSPNWAPIVPDGQYNDMAQLLGMYHFGAGPKVYLGWFGPADDGPDYNGFIGHKGIPRGLYDMWAQSGTGRILSYVIGDYPKSFTCPYIMNSANHPPSGWNAVYRNLRIVISVSLVVAHSVITWA